MLFCACLYCNFDSETQKCSGVCPLAGFPLISNQCISRVLQPKSNADCGCASCQMSYDFNGTAHCSGHCFESGLSCKIAQIPAYTSLGFIEHCSCQ